LGGSQPDDSLAGSIIPENDKVNDPFWREGENMITENRHSWAGSTSTRRPDRRDTAQKRHEFSMATTHD